MRIVDTDMANPRSFTARLLPALGLSLALLLTACGGSSSEPTVDPEAIATFAFQTFTAKLATDEAANTPTFTPPPPASPTPFPTLAPLSTLPGLSFSSPVPPAASCENESTWIADVTVPDGTTFTPGEDFTKTWLVQNTGTCTWNTKYMLKFKDGTKMAGTDEFVQISVPPAQQVEVSADLEAPDEIGSFYGRWQLYDADGHAFGSILTVVIKVKAATP